MANIKTDSSKLRKQADELKKLNEQFKTEVTNLTNTESQLNSMWDGDARKAFHDAYNRDKGQMDKFYTGINSYVTALNEIASSYDKAEQQNTDTAKTRSYGKG